MSDDPVRQPVRQMSQDGVDGVARATTAQPRAAERRRVTGETDVYVALGLDAAPAELASSSISTGVPFFDHMLSAFARHGRFVLRVKATGDLEIDDHHTVEDVGLVLGQTLLAALGERRGIARFGAGFAPMDEALARAVVDISGRPSFVYDTGPVRLAERVGRFDTQLAEEFWRAFATEARLALHLDLLRGSNSHHALEALFKAAALALHAATRVALPGGDVPSTKGVLG